LRADVNAGQRASSRNPEEKLVPEKAEARQREKGERAPLFSIRLKKDDRRKDEADRDSADHGGNHMAVGGDMKKLV
jgi:hypothetical protein